MLPGRVARRHIDDTIPGAALHSPRRERAVRPRTASPVVRGRLTLRVPLYSIELAPRYIPANSRPIATAVTTMVREASLVAPDRMAEM
jgi:hypothetical protein